MVSTITVKAFIDSRVVNLGAKVLNHERFERLGCRPIVYPYGLCCEEPNPRAEYLSVCDYVRKNIEFFPLAPMIPVIETARDFFNALLNPRRVRLVACSPKPKVCVIRLDDAGRDMWIYRRKGFWVLGNSYIVKQAIEEWCREMRGSHEDCHIYNGAAIIAAILEDYVLRLSIPNPYILIPDPNWHTKVLLHSIKVRPRL